MKYLIKKILYRSVFSSGPFYNIGMVPASGTLVIRTEDSDNGRLMTYELAATVSRGIRRIGDAALEGDLHLIVTYDNGLEAHIGTAERPVRLKQELTDTLMITCTWKELP